MGRDDLCLACGVELEAEDYFHGRCRKCREEGREAVKKQPKVTVLEFTIAGFLSSGFRGLWRWFCYPLVFGIILVLILMLIGLFVDTGLEMDVEKLILGCVGATVGGYFYNCGIYMSLVSETIFSISAVKCLLAGIAASIPLGLIPAYDSTSLSDIAEAFLITTGFMLIIMIAGYFRHRRPDL